MAVGVPFDKIIRYIVTAVCTQPLHIGSASGDKEEVLVHPVDDIPFIQASSIAGVFRERYIQDQGQADELFGARKHQTDENSAEHGSRVRFSDGKFLCTPVLELRPRVSINPETGTCGASTIKGTEKKAGHKFNMEYIGAGAEFTFSIYLYDDGRQADMEGLLAAVHKEQVQFGGQKSNGCGYMRLKNIKKTVFDMTTLEGRRQWANEDEPPEQQKGKEILDLVTAKQNNAEAYEIRVTGSTEGNMLIKSIAVPECGEGAPDCMNIRNANKDYIVPGSSLKGAVRNQMERIAAYLGRQEIIRDTFGCVGSSSEDGKAGNIVFYDTVVGDREENDLAELSHRIHIDKFTGGVMDGSLFQEKNIAGELVFHISIRNKNQPDRTCGLLLMALRDMAVKMMSVGGGYNVGKGMIDVRKISVTDWRGGKEAVIDLEKGKIAGDQAVIARCVHAAQTKEEAV